MYIILPPHPPLQTTLPNNPGPLRMTFDPTACVVCRAAWLVLHAALILGSNHRARRYQKGLPGKHSKPESGR